LHLFLTTDKFPNFPKDATDQIITKSLWFFREYVEITRETVIISGLVRWCQSISNMEPGEELANAALDMIRRMQKLVTDKRASFNKSCKELVKCE
jgi:hypothetical protein